MTSRLTRPQMFMRIAHIVSERSTCARLNVGAVITARNRIVSIGWNGQPPQEEHCVGHRCPSFEKSGSCNTTHAEVNAMAYVPEEVAPLPLTLYVTDSPCLSCVQAILKSGLWFEAVYFGRAYRVTDSLDALVVAGIPVFQQMPAGHVVPWAVRT